MDNPVEPGSATALTCPPDAPLTRALAPPVPDPWPSGGPWDDWEADERFHVLPGTTARCTPFLTAPETHPVLRGEIHQFDEQADRYERWISRLRVDGSTTYSRDPYTVGHVLGHARSIQDDVREAATLEYPDHPTFGDEDAWEVLLAIHMDDEFGIDIHDGGAFHLLVPSSDLASGALDRLICDISSG